jgi:hypothetical protein
VAASSPASTADDNFFAGTMDSGAADPDGGFSTSTDELGDYRSRE